MVAVPQWGVFSARLIGYEEAMGFSLGRSALFGWLRAGANYAEDCKSRCVSCLEVFLVELVYSIIYKCLIIYWVEK